MSGALVEDVGMDDLAGMWSMGVQKLLGGGYQWCLRVFWCITTTVTAIRMRVMPINDLKYRCSFRNATPRITAVTG